MQNVALELSLEEDKSALVAINFGNDFKTVIRASTLYDTVVRALPDRFDLFPANECVLHIHQT